MNATAVIPARYASSRFPGKPLAVLGGVPMVVRTARRVLQAQKVTEVLVATDDARIGEACDTHGVPWILTAHSHPTGTDRVAEVVEAANLDPVVNVQGDEPLVDPKTIDAVLAGLVRDPEASVSNAACPLNEADLENTNVVKAVSDKRGRLLYISRHCVPFCWDPVCPRKRHLGLYGFRRTALSDYAAREQGPLERAERIEMLRFLEYGDAIVLVDVPPSPPAVDVPQDVERIERYVAEHGGWEAFEDPADA